MKTLSRRGPEKSKNLRGLQNRLRRLRRSEVEYLVKFLGSSSALSSLLKVDRSSVSRWERGTFEPRGTERIDALLLVLNKLSRVYMPEVASQWLEGINTYVGNQRPIDLIRRGRFSEVMAALEQADTLAYA